MKAQPARLQTDRAAAEERLATGGIGKTGGQERRPGMRFQYYQQDPMDEIPAPPLKMILSLLGITVLFLAILYGVAFALGFRF